MKISNEIMIEILFCIGISFAAWYINYQDNPEVIFKKQLKKQCKILGLKARKFKKMTSHELKSAFRSAVKDAHPDHGGSSEKFRSVKDAYEFLQEARVYA